MHIVGLSLHITAVASGNGERGLVKLAHGACIDADDEPAGAPPMLRETGFVTQTALCRSGEHPGTTTMHGPSCNCAI